MAKSAKGLLSHTPVSSMALARRLRPSMSGATVASFIGHDRQYARRHYSVAGLDYIPGITLSFCASIQLNPAEVFRDHEGGTGTVGRGFREES